MGISNLFGITDAFAGAATTGTTLGSSSGSLTSMLLPLAIFIVVFYFLLIRPQSKRTKEHRKLLDSVTKDDEVMTAGGLMGKVVEVDDTSVVLKIAKDTDVKFQKSAITTVLPKGTLKFI